MVHRNTPVKRGATSTMTWPKNKPLPGRIAVRPIANPPGPKANDQRIGPVKNTGPAQMKPMKPAGHARVEIPRFKPADRLKPHTVHSKQDRPPGIVQRTSAGPKSSTQVPTQRPNASVRNNQPRQSGVVQAIKLYPNLHPGAVEPVNANNLFRLNHFAGQYRLHRVNSHGVNVPNLQYNFVRTREGEMLLHNRYRHPSIAEGKQVLYAGEVFFNNGQLQWWSNGSGHYQPYAEDAEQANLPMDQFYSYQQVIKGEHKRKKG